MLTSLPSEVKMLIKAYSSDKLPPTPTASLIKRLQFRYHESTEDAALYYLPRRLEVRVDEPIRFIVYDDHHIRRFYLNDFLPSYWSAYANTFDTYCPKQVEERSHEAIP